MTSSGKSVGLLPSNLFAIVRPSSFSAILTTDILLEAYTILSLILLPDGHV